jgi:hypothetical protein
MLRSSVSKSFAEIEKEFVAKYDVPAGKDITFYNEAV